MNNMVAGKHPHPHVDSDQIQMQGQSGTIQLTVFCRIQIPLAVQCADLDPLFKYLNLQMFKFSFWEARQGISTIEPTLGR